MPCLTSPRQFASTVKRGQILSEIGGVYGYLKNVLPSGKIPRIEILKPEKMFAVHEDGLGGDGYDWSRLDLAMDVILKKEAALHARVGS